MIREPAETARHIPLSGAYNVRDLGGYETPSGGRTRWRRLLRADSLHALSPEARDELIRMGVTTVIDLRHADELAQSPNVFADHPGVRYVNVPLFAGMSRSQNIASVGIADAPSGATFDLEALYKGALERCQDAFFEVFTTIASSDGVTLFHCTAGKDRTGLIAALILGSLGVSDDSIVEDYALTATYIQPLLETLRQEAVSKGHDLDWYDRLLTSEPATMRATLEYLGQRHGGAGGYLKSLGLGEDQISRLRAALIEG